MIKMPKKGFFESRDTYVAKIAEIFEVEGLLSPRNANYAALYWIDNSGIVPEHIVLAIRKLIAHGSDVSKAMNIKIALKEISVIRGLENDPNA